MAQQNHTKRAEESSSHPDKDRVKPTPTRSTPLLLQRAYADPSSLTPDDVKHLQRTIGNRATVGVLANHVGLQAKLKLNAPDDRFKQEAYGVAQGAVSRGISAQPAQRKEKEEEELQMKPLSQSTMVKQGEKGFVSTSTRTTFAPIEQSASRPVVQRNEESAELLKKLAKPQTFEGPTVDVQNKIVEALEKEFEKIPKEQLTNYNPSCLGGIVLDPSEGTDFETLLKKAVLIDLPPQSTKDPKSRAVGVSSFSQAKAAGVEKEIILNTLATMDKAGQLEYLRKSGLLTDKGWEIVVEIHYYRERNKSQTRLHKDTLGQTLFVNLNYVNAEVIQGPEFIINPDLSGKNFRQQEYVDSMRENLPEEFVKDVEEVKTYYGEPTEIGMSEIPAYGVVAFVDEAIHHKTPTMGHRKASGGNIRRAVQKKYPEGYKTAKEAYDKFKNQLFWYGYASYLKDPKDATTEQWYTLLEGTNDEKIEFDRTEIEKLLPKSDFVDIDELIEEGGYGDFGRADVNYAKRVNVAVKKKDKPPLTRQMSQAMLKGYEPKVSTGPRRFFRTWVRGIKK